MPRFCAELIPAMVTPFAADGSLDLPAAQALACRLIDAGCDGLLVNGTTGECPTMTLDEKIALIHAVKQAVAGRGIPIMSGCGGNDTHKSVDEARQLAAQGVDALLVVVPYYNKPTQRGMMAHFRAIAQAVPDTEIVIYNIPSRCVVRMDADTMAALHLECPNIIGVKQSFPDMDALSEIIARLPAASWLTWCGDDTLTLPMLACGAHGVVSVLAHVAAAPMRRMIQAFKQGDVSQARHLHLKLLHPGRELFFLPNPTVIKTLLAQRGDIPSARMRPPLVCPDDAEQARIDRLFQHMQACCAAGACAR